MNVKFETINGQLYITTEQPCPHCSQPEIIATPVTEGSAEWWWYQMIIGNKICQTHNLSFNLSLPNRRYYAIKDGNDYCAFYNNDGTEVSNVNTRRSYQEFIEYCDFTSQYGWQIYTEPQPTKEPIADCNNCKYVCKKSNIDYCHMYEPKPTYKVGGWVRTEDGDGEFMSYAKGHVYDNSVFFSVNYVTYDAFIRLTTGKYEVYPVSSLIKLAPSEVVVPILLRGKVCSYDGNNFQLTNIPSGFNNIIAFDALDAPTRELVESLLKAQEEK